MANELFLAAAGLWALASIAALVGLYRLSQAGLALGGLAGLAGAFWALPDGSAVVHLPFGIAGAGVDFAVTPLAAWLLAFGLIAAAVTVALGSPARRPAWCFGAAMALIGALGVFGLQDGVAFLVAWELMSLGGALLVLSEGLAPDSGKPVLFMLALLEVGSVALVIAILVLAGRGGGFAFSDFAGAGLSPAAAFWIGMLLLVGFGAKLGLLPFYEWFPATYGAASGATGALLSGVILNAAFFGLTRGLTGWIALSSAPALLLFDAIVLAAAVISTILTALYAFQQEDWRALLGFSSAENASVAVALLAASLIFARDGLPELASLALLAALIHLAGHTLAKSALFLAADGVFGAAGSYALKQSGLLRKSRWLYGVGAVFAAMSLAAMPPQAGFVSEWYLFQTMFNGFHLSTLGDRLLLVLAGAGLALTAAIALATFVKVIGIGLLGRGRTIQRGVTWPNAAGVGILGIAVLVLAAGMPVWLTALNHAAPAGYAADAAARMHDGWLLVPLTAAFAFISPSKLVLVWPLFALIPLGLLLLAGARATRVPVWYGGREQDPLRTATTALSFSNALRTFYSFVYRPSVRTTREVAEEGHRHPYFVRRLVFSHSVAPVFGPLLFRPAAAAILWTATRLRALQSGHLNFYLFLIGILLVAILVVALL